MHSTLLLTQLALWTSTTQAFFPYTPSWLEEINEKRALESKNGGVKRNEGGALRLAKQRADRDAMTDVESGHEGSVVSYPGLAEEMSDGR